MLYHCRMWCYAIGVEAVVLRSWCVILCTVCQLVSNFFTYIYDARSHLYRINSCYKGLKSECVGWSGVGGGEGLVGKEAGCAS